MAEPKRDNRWTRRCLQISRSSGKRSSSIEFTEFAPHEIRRHVLYAMKRRFFTFDFVDFDRQGVARNRRWGPRFVRGSEEKQ